MLYRFPYDHLPPLDIPDDNLIGFSKRAGSAPRLLPRTS
jgi:hypothetical protein